MLIGLGLNGRRQIERDKRQAIAHHELKLREDRLRIRLHELRQLQKDLRQRAGEAMSDQ